MPINDNYLFGKRDIVDSSIKNISLSIVINRYQCKAHGNLNIQASILYKKNAKEIEKR